MVGLPGKFEVAFEFGEHEFRVLKGNVQERDLGLNLLGSYQHCRG